MTETYYTRHILPLLNDSNPITAITYLRQKRILHYAMFCTHCNSQMKQVNRKSSTDKFAFRCDSKNCIKYKMFVSIRNNSFLDNFSIPLNKFIHFLFLYSKEIEQSKISEFVGISISLIYRLTKKIREKCDEYFLQNKLQLGGPGIIVQIDESKFNYNAKSHRGRSPTQPIWVFGMVDTSYSPARGIMRIVERRDKVTLLGLINEYIKPETIIHSDEWKAYSDLHAYGYQHGTVCHKYQFIDPISNVHTQHVESYWSRQKLRIKKSKGLLKIAMKSILNEYMFRDLFNDHCYEAIIEHLISIKTR